MLDEVFRIAFEQSAAGIAVTAPGGEYLHANQAFCDFVGYSLDELRALVMTDLMAPDDGRRAAEILEQIYRGEDPETGWEHRYIHKSGLPLWALLTTTLVRDEHGAPAYLISQVIDISDRKQAEDALRESEDQLRQAQKMEAVGQLAGGIAHDFNNLLMAIMSNAELAALELSPTAPAAPHIDEIKSASRRARALTQQLLAFSRKQMLQPRVLDLNVVVRDAEQILRRLIGETIEMSVKLDASLGQVRADQGQLVQVLMNLAVNARDAMPSGGQLSIESSNRDVTAAEAGARRGLRDGRYVVLQVRDSGVGMDDDTMARIFEPFFTTKPPGHGTGLGLSTAYGIVKQSGGYIAVDSRIGEGTTFTIMLPRVFEPSEPAAAPQPEVPATPSRGTVLLVEDESAVRKATKRMLRRFGFSVIEAKHGSDALAQWEEHGDAVDVVLTDVVMPSMGGAELVRSLRERKPRLRVVFMSGYTQGTLELSTMDEAATRFLPKPFTADLLVKTLRELID